MPEPEVSNQIDEGAAQPQTPWNPPVNVADISFDELFTNEDDLRQVSQDVTPDPTVPAEGADATPSPEPTQSAASQPPAHPAAEPPKGDQFFLETSTGSKYKTADEAKRGFEHKDQLITDLRNKMIAITGVDPINQRPVGSQPQATPKSYLRDPNRFVEDLSKGAQEAAKGNSQMYRDTLLGLVDEYLQSNYGHLVPQMQKLGQHEAVDVVAQEIPSFRDFYNSESYQKALERRPKLAEAIQRAEQTPGLQEEYLPELYKTAWDVALAMKTPELVNGRGATPSPTNNPAPRMPMTSSHLAPPRESVSPSSSVSTNPNTVEGRKAITEARRALIKDLEQRGIGNVRF